MIRLATAADEALVRAITRAAYQQYEPILGAPAVPVTENYAPRIAAGEVWLLGEDGVLVIERHPDHATIFNVAVRPERVGAGLGRILLDAAERMAASWGVAELRLYTNALMTRNLAIYAGRGFRETGRRPNPARPIFTIVDMVKPIVPAEAELRRLLDVMARLRAPDGCPWDQVQDFDSIAPYTIEEAYEVADAIARRDWADLPDELGDLLFQVVYHARMAEEAGRFAFADVARAVTDKMIRRHPHVFAGGAPQAGAWEAGKSAERATRQQHGTLAGVPTALPALTRATKLTARAARVGFDWPDAAAVLDKLAEETAELRAELEGTTPSPHPGKEPSPSGRGLGEGSATNSDDRFSAARTLTPPSGAFPPASQAEPSGASALSQRERETASEMGGTFVPDPTRLADELGDMLFVLANLARKLGLDPETCLRGANAKFTRRFEGVETRLAAEGRTPADADLAAMEAAWQAVKAGER